MKRLAANHGIRLALGFVLLLWTSVPAAAADKTTTSCLEALKSQAAPDTKLTVTRVDGDSFEGWLQRVDPGDGTLRLKTFDPAASRFSSVDMHENEMLSLTYHRSTTDPGLMLLFVTGGITLGALLGVELAGGSLGDFTNGESNIELGVGALGLLGALAGLITGLVLAPKSSEPVTLDCGSASP